MEKKIEKSNDHYKKRYMYNTAMRLGTSLNSLSIYRCN